MLRVQRRFLIAGIIPFLCVFSQTLLQYNIIFALGGMVNHTLADWEEWQVIEEEQVHGDLNFPGTCIKVGDEGLMGGKVDIYDDGPFPWDAEIEGLINAIISAGSMVGTLMTLFVYDHIDGNLVFAIALGFPGLISILTPIFAENGGYQSVVIFRFFTGLYTSILTPVIPTLVSTWFLPTELYKMNIIVFLGMETGRMFFCFTGNIIDNFGWEFLFYFPGVLAVILGFLYFLIMTDDPLENPFLYTEEKQMIADAQERMFVSIEDPKLSRRQKIMKRMMKNKMNINISRTGAHKKSVPWKSILTEKMLWISALQATGQAWTTVMMVLMNKEYLEEIHGYTLQEAAIMVTIPNNVAQFFIALATGFFGDFLLKKNVSKITIRRFGSIVQILAVLPMLILPFLPCNVMEYRVAMILIQVLSSFRVVGNLSGYSSYRDISPTYQRHLFGVAAIISQCIPGIVVPALMGVFDTETIIQWKYNYVTNCSFVIFSNLVYCFLVSTDRATWDPGSRIKERGGDETRSIIESIGARSYVFEANRLKKTS